MLSVVSVCSHGVVPPYNPPRHVQTFSNWTALYRDPPNIFKLVQVILNCKGALSPPHPQNQTCSELFIVKQGLSARGRLVSYWNGFLLGKLPVLSIMREVIGQLDPFKMLRSSDEPKLNFEIILSKISTSLTRHLA